MANRFLVQPQQQSQPNIFEQFNSFRNNPQEFLSRNGINIPQQYANSPEQMGKYLLANMPQTQQGQIFQTVNALRSMFGR